MLYPRTESRSRRAMLYSVRVVCLLAALWSSACVYSPAQGGIAAAGDPQRTSIGDWQLDLPGEAQIRSGALAGQYYVAGATYFQHAGKVEAQAGMARLSSGAAGAKQLSAAVYAVPMAGQEPAQVLVEAYTNLCPTDAGCEYWVGVANYSKSRWEWQGPYTQSMAVVEVTGSAVLSPSQDLVLAVLVYDGAACYVAGLEVNPQLYSVGPGQTYSRLEEAYDDAADGGTILVHPQAGGAAYIQPALQVYKPDIRFIGVIEAGVRVRLDGAGYNYTGAGSIPRAIFQFNPEADGGYVSGFELENATNDTHNGAGVRINQANDVMVRNCEIHACDMGVMSNGSVADDSARGQRLEFCRIASNGNLDDPGYNHNLYLGGASVLVRCCEIANAVTGHNFKSRAHFNQVESCYIHDSANREFDLVDDAENTGASGSHSVLVGNVIVKDPLCSGNRAVIQFGQDGGGEHQGTLYLVHNTIATPFMSPVVTLSASGAGLALYNNIIWDMASGQSGQQLVAASGGAQLADASGGHNWLSAGQSIAPGTAFDIGSMHFAPAGVDPPFANPLDADRTLRDYSLAAPDAHIADEGVAWTALSLPAGPGLPALEALYHYHYPHWLTARPEVAAPDLGAYEYPGTAP